MIEELHHIQIAIPKNQENKARTFYGGILGFSEIEKPSALRGRGGVWFQAHGIRLHIGVEDPFTPAKKAHPGFRVTSLKHAVSHLDASGIAYRTDMDFPDMKRIYINDPFGNRIELLEVTST
ncbi:glyoxalase [Sulfitobacter sp. SK012]|uniref:VOC family protein n=1 Tax=Sulfitobacter sp. SK012 TaxID=1389005 RepID=UPI000E0B9FBA|nr:VOC family protein [Sulfitobacter sp. SK012]AXI47856.1 glyoxalase [Sulfitobacter sp. SK012]